MTRNHNTTIGELISIFYAEFMALYGDEELASRATAALINELISQGERTSTQKAA